MARQARRARRTKRATSSPISPSRPRRRPAPISRRPIWRAPPTALTRILDPVNGGLGGAPKFPNAPIFRFLWSESFRARMPALRGAVRALLDALCAGGIYDHLGGGFARYSVDGEWRVPHFEKMLYDNAQILELLALAYAETPTPRLRRAGARNLRLADARDARRRGLRRLARRR